MTRILVSSERKYEVFVDCDWYQVLKSQIEGRSKIAVVFSQGFPIDKNIFQGIDDRIVYICVPDGEGAKDESTLANIWYILGKSGFTRGDLIVGIGGGAITDVTGFAAATWLRGVDWIAIPTTVAAMVDASIGGKTGINSQYGKNLIGAFHSPQAVLIDLSWLESLSDRDFAAGLAEVVKTGFIADQSILKLLRGRKLDEIRANLELQRELLIKSISVKGEIVSEDFRESFARESLNYGHTLGHAIELHSSFSLRHGEAVSIGLCFIAELQFLLGILTEEERSLHFDLLSSLGLPTKYLRSAWPQLLASMSLDKKSRGKHLRFVTLDGIGKTKRVEDPDELILQQAYERISS